jgi:hypothetical protein
MKETFPTRRIITTGLFSSLVMAPLTACAPAVSENVDEFAAKNSIRFDENTHINEGGGERVVIGQILKEIEDLVDPAFAPVIRDKIEIAGYQSAKLSATARDALVIALNRKVGNLKAKKASR